MPFDPGQPPQPPAPAAQPPPPAPAPSARAPRLPGIDAARALAVIGMVMVHVGPAREPGPGLAAALYALPRGRASILFVVLAGIGVSLSAGAGSRDPVARRRAAAVLLQRAAVLLPAGLALQLLDHGVLVILQYYALYFLVAAAALWLPDRVVLAAAVLLVVAGPVAYLAAQQAQPIWFDRPPVELGAPPSALAVDLLLAGSYPVLTWSGPLLFGLWLGRRDLRAPTVQVRLLAGGMIVALLAWGLAATLTGLLGPPAAAPSWEALASTEAHSQMPLWLASASGSAAAIVGLCLLRLPSPPPPAPAVPLAHLGQLALTMYVAHLLVLAADADLLRRAEVGPATVSTLLFTVLAAGVATAWRRRFRRGPLEALLRWPRR